MLGATPLALDKCNEFLAKSDVTNLNFTSLGAIGNEDMLSSLEQVSNTSNLRPFGANRLLTSWCATDRQPSR